MISVELRKIIIADREKGIPAEEIHKVLGVSIPAIYDIVRKYKERGTLEGNYSGRPAKITAEQKGAMLKLVEEQPDITLEEIIGTLNLPIKKSRVSKILRDEKMFFKKEAGTRQRTKA